MNRCCTRFPRAKRALLAIGFVLLLLSGRQHAAVPWENFRIGQVLLLNGDQRSDPRLLPFRPLLAVRNGENYQYRNVRTSIENLSRAGVFSDIEVKVQVREDDLLDVFFILQRKPVIRELDFSGISSISKRELRAAIYSLHRNAPYEESQLPKALGELQALFRSRGYFNAQISPRVSLEGDRSGCVVQFVIAAGKVARIRRLQVNVDDPLMARIVPGFFRGKGLYIPGEFAKGIEKTRSLLRRNAYPFPQINVKEDFLDPERSALDVTVTVTCGYKYHYEFRGMAAKWPLIADVWERQVSEKWAEEESRARLLNYMKNEGYLDARVTSAITIRGIDKRIVFTV
jgi:outer membrane protein assembly factor BamA